MTEVVATPRNAGLGVGTTGFVKTHGLYSDEQARRAEEVAAEIERRGLRTVRLLIVDQHGVPRSKFLSAGAALASMRNGSDFSGAIYSLDTGNGVFPPAFAAGGGFGMDEFTGFPDITIVPDPTTFQVLPWADRTGAMICDAYFSNGTPLPIDGRTILRTQVQRLRAAGYGYVAGLEVECYIVRRARDRIGLEETGQSGRPGPAPEVDVVEPGFQFLSDGRLDSIADTLEAIRDGLWEIGLPPRSIENEWGPGQIEFTFSPLEGLGPADAMILFRSAVKAICHRRGLLASFMCWPALPNFFPSGWHLHESLVSTETGDNAFADQREVLSQTGRQFAAGLLEHAKAMTIFGNPTVNGYGRFRPYSFAPDRICWAVDNRGALIRVQGSPGDSGSHVENRLGEPAANPYLFLAANIAAGLDGIEQGAEPPPLVEADPYTAEAEPLPQSLGEAIAELDGSALYRKQFGDGFVDYYLMMKRAELARYEEAIAKAPPATGHVSDWEMREYFEFY